MTKNFGDLPPGGPRFGLALQSKLHVDIKKSRRFLKRIKKLRDLVKRFYHFTYYFHVARNHTAMRNN